MHVDRISEQHRGPTTLGFESQSAKQYARDKISLLQHFPTQSGFLEFSESTTTTIFDNHLPHTAKMTKINSCMFSPMVLVLYVCTGMNDDNKALG